MLYILDLIYLSLGMLLPITFFDYTLPFFIIFHLLVLVIVFIIR